MSTILTIMFSGFWSFLGMIILIGLVFELIGYLYKGILITIVAMKHGWPKENETFLKIKKDKL